MANILGKRKRRADLEPAEDISTHNTDDTHLRLLLQKHFEAKYEPLETSPLPKAVDLDTESQSASEDEADWNGLSDTEDHLPVETIEHVSIHSLELAPKEELKTFMTTKPPSNQAAPTKVVQKKGQDKLDDPTTEVSLLASDLELQRLLRESHLLSSSNISSNSSLAPTGAARYKALDLRLQSIGAKSSLMEQKSMPMLHRRGIEQKKKEKEADRRKEAREAGVILEKEKKVVRTSRGRSRGKDIGAPGIGKMKSATLRISKRDVAEIERGGAQSRRSGKKRIW